MEEKKNIPYFGCIDFLSGQRPEGLPKARVIKTGKPHHTENNAPIEVKRSIRGGVRRLAPGESIDWREYYS